MVQLQLRPNSSNLIAFPKAAFEIRNALLRGDMVVGQRYKAWHCDGMWRIRFGGVVYERTAPLGVEDVAALAAWMLATG